MANLQKFKMAAVGHLFLHNNRTVGDNINHGNKDIDPSRTKENYFLKQGGLKELSARLDEVFYLKRKNTVVVGGFCVTLPDNVPENSEDESIFFDAVYDFYANDFGERNIISAAVHKDENNPHLHIIVVPVVSQNVSEIEMRSARRLFDEWLREKKIKDGDTVEHLCARECFTSQYLETMHDRLSEFVQQRLGYEANLITGETAGVNRTINELKAESLRQQVEIEQKRLNSVEADMQRLSILLEKNGLKTSDLSLYTLLQHIDDCHRENKILRNIISRNNYTYTRDDIDALSHKRYVPAESAVVSVLPGQLTTNELVNKDNAIYVVEVIPITPEERKKTQAFGNQRTAPGFNRSQFVRTPSEDFFKKSSDVTKKAEIHFNTYNAKKNEGYSRVSKLEPIRMLNQARVILVVTDPSLTGTLEAITLLIEQLKKMKAAGMKDAIYIQKFENDKYDFLKSCLESERITSRYFLGDIDAEKQKDEKSQDKPVQSVN